MLKKDQSRKGLIFEIIVYLLWLLINSINPSIEEEEGMATIVVVVMEEVTTMANSLVVNLLNFLMAILSFSVNPTMVKVSFPLPSHNASLTFQKVRGQCVRSDVWGPTPFVSVLDHKFNVIFVDDFTRFTWLFLL